MYHKYRKRLTTAYADQPNALNAPIGVAPPIARISRPSARLLSLDALRGFNMF